MTDETDRRFGWTREASLPLSGKTLGELYGPVAEIHTKAEAEAYFGRLVATVMVHGRLKSEEAERVVRHNIGYWAGYYSHETRMRIEELFQCEHPFLGSASVHMTPEQIIAVGREIGMRGKS